eukprot:753088-Hanusia_phi.AAC.11
MMRRLVGKNGRGEVQEHEKAKLETLQLTRYVLILSSSVSASNACEKKEISHSKGEEKVGGCPTLRIMCPVLYTIQEKMDSALQDESGCDLLSVPLLQARSGAPTPTVEHGDLLSDFTLQRPLLHLRCSTVDVAGVRKLQLLHLLLELEVPC